LSHIREVDAICQVVRCFEDGNITHVEGNIDPLRDIETIKIELNLSDLDSIDKRIARLDKKAKAKLKEAILEHEILSKIKAVLDENGNPRLLEFDEESMKIVKNFNLLSMKPMIYIANVA
jgi:ribosome-binding ATPase YchF (GTP1/OBG family)